eukprot:GHVS01063054.1.p1 GENE.GHVS01063054.1~~GHVS01063054.1.p1  ORF type:complete len:421 (+),score=68.78 GHVS01063054.1:102-1364(+)
MAADLSIGSAFSSPSADICGFRYRPTYGYVKYVCRDGQGGEGELVSGNAITLSIMSNALHYGQALFEGLKVFSTKPQNGSADGDVCVFCDGMNYERMKDGARRLGMEMVSKKTWTKAIDWCVTANRQFLPSYYGNRKGGLESKEGSCGVVDGCSLYLRPMLFGSGELLTPVPSNEFTFLVMCMPVSTQYYAKPAQPASSTNGSSTGSSITGGGNGNINSGLVGVKLNSVDCLVLDEYDRAAPRGVGFVKAAGNYAADIYPSTLAKKKGYPICLYLDAIHKEFVEEFNTSNFVAIVKKTSSDAGKSEYVYITPPAEGWGATVLASVTNRCLQKLAQEEFRMDVEKRRISFEKEIGSFIEVGAVGTAVVITKIKSFTKGDKKWNIDVQEGGVLDQLYSSYTKIQRGEKEDKHGWMRKVDMKK